MSEVTCLIPAWNESARIGGVLAAVIGHPRLARVIVIDDGSTDGTGDLARAMGATVLRTPGNTGKTRALLAGLALVETPHVLLLDADLGGLTPAAITALISPVVCGVADASISLRGNAPWPWRLIGVDYISGERVLPMALLSGMMADLSALPRFGFEVRLNRELLLRQGPVAIVDWPDVISPSKAAKRGRMAGALADLAMMGDIFRTVAPLECLRQILGLRRLRLAAPPGRPIRRLAFATLRRRFR